MSGRAWLRGLLVAMAISAAAIAANGSALAPGLVPLPDMPGPRAAHSATLLRDGRVLIAGGCHANGCEEGISGDALTFDPRTRKFAPTGSLIQPRVGHRALRLRNGNVVLLGGWTTRGATSLVEAYDPATGRFVHQGKLLHARDGFSATPLADGNILIAGGYSGAMQRLASAELYDPRTGVSSAAGAMSTPRMSHTATVLDDGRVLLAGGSSARGALLHGLEIFDPKTSRFKRAGHLQKARHKHAAVRVGSDVLLIGGAGVDESTQQYRDSERWNAAEGAVVPGPVMREGRYKFADAVVGLRDGRLLVAGSGRQAELLDASATRFTPVGGSLGTDLSFTTATRLLDGSVLVAGGYGPDIHPSRRAWLYPSR